MKLLNYMAAGRPIVSFAGSARALFMARQGGPAAWKASSQPCTPGLGPT